MRETIKDRRTRAQLLQSEENLQSLADSRVVDEQPIVVSQPITTAVEADLGKKPSVVESNRKNKRKNNRRGLAGPAAILAAGAVAAAFIFSGGLKVETTNIYSVDPTAGPSVPGLESGTPSPSGAEGTPGPSGMASPDASASVAPSASPLASTEALASQNEGAKMSNAVSVPEVISGSMVREVRAGGQSPMFTEGQWFLPVYDLTQEGKAQNYRGIGPWYPVAFENVDPNAAVLTTHGNVGELVVSGRAGGNVMVAFMQLDAHQHDGAWGTDPATGRFMQNPKWEMQYNFHSLQPLEEIQVVNPDTGNNLLWPDGSPVIYRANEQGIAAFEIPATSGNDVRVGFVFKMPAQGIGQQPPEVKIERGPNDNPKQKGENPLPKTVLKPIVTEK
jgi:hypothetical protein